MVKTQSPVPHWDENVKCMRFPLPVKTGASPWFLFLMRVYAFPSLLSIRRGEWSSMVWSIQRSEASSILTTGAQPEGSHEMLWSCLRPLSFGAPCSCPSRNHCPSRSMLAVVHLPESQAFGEAQVFPRDFYSLTILGLPQGVPCMAHKGSHWLL